MPTDVNGAKPFHVESVQRHHALIMAGSLRYSNNKPLQFAIPAIYDLRFTIYDLQPNIAATPCCAPYNYASCRTRRVKKLASSTNGIQTGQNTTR